MTRSGDLLFCMLAKGKTEVQVDVCDFVEDVLLAVEPFAAMEL